MDAIEAILTRRSIRKYRSEPVPDEIVERLIRAAMAAPSSMNLQPWHFVVLKDRDILDEIPKFHPHSKMLSGASLAILVCGDLKVQQIEGYLVHRLCHNSQKYLFAGAGVSLEHLLPVRHTTSETLSAI